MFIFSSCQQKAASWWQRVPVNCASQMWYRGNSEFAQAAEMVVKTVEPHLGKYSSKGLTIVVCIWKVFMSYLRA